MVISCAYVLLTKHFQLQLIEVGIARMYIEI